AIAAARQGQSALLIEESGHIGLHVPIALGVVVGIRDWRPTLQEGLLRDFAVRVAQMGQYAQQPLSPEQTLQRGEIIIRNHDVASTAMLALLREAGVTLLFHTKFVEAVVEQGQLRAIVVETPAGRRAVVGKVFVDSTGLGDVAARAGAPMKREEAFLG